VILCLDVGNTSIHAGVYDSKGLLRVQFRKASESRGSSDESGLFLRAALRENGVDPQAIQSIAICSVVPDAIFSLKGACQKYFQLQPFLLQAGVRTGLKIKYRNPLEVGADRIANSIAGCDLHPNENLIIVDFGTATTFDAVSASREYLGGSILAGLKISVEALETRTAKLPSVEIVQAPHALGRSTVESIQSGLFFGQIGMIRELVQRLRSEAFQGEAARVLATGGFAGLFEGQGLFDQVVPDLVLKGLLIAHEMNRSDRSDRGQNV
jgi:type III pantothenate kinase